MTKEELKEAIASTIVENGQKGITATALAALLNEIVDAAGSGGGGTGGAVFVDLMVEGPNEGNASAYKTLVNGWSTGTLYPVIAQYILPISVYAYSVDESEDLGGVGIILDLTPIFGEASLSVFLLKSDGSWQLEEM